MLTINIELLLADLALIAVLARLFGAVARRFNQPPVIGEIIAALALGPTLFGGAIKRNLFPEPIQLALGGLATLGLVLFMFVVGYELDTALVRGRERIAATISFGSIALPMASGSLLGIWLAHRHGVTDVLPFALFIGASMSVTAFPVLARILTDRGLHRTRLGGLAIASAAFDDVAAWTLLAIVLTISRSGSADQWHLYLTPVYLAVMYFVVRPLVCVVRDRYQRLGRLTPDLLAVVLATLLLSACATEWLGIHYIFGAFIMGAAMPRRDGAALQQSILERLEQLGVLVLLPVFFVVAALKADLSQIAGDRAVEFAAVLAVAIIGKFAGAYLGAAACHLSRRHAATVATLMNTRGLTEIVILTVGQQMGIIDDQLFSIMVLMAVVTTIVTGPLLRVVYPPRLVDRDLAEAQRAAVAAGSGYRIWVLVPSEENTALVDMALDLASSRRPARVMLCQLVTQRHNTQLEIGVGADLLTMTRSLAALHLLAARGAERNVVMSVYVQFSDDFATDAARQIRSADPDLVLLPPGAQVDTDHLMPRLVELRATPPDRTTAVAVSPLGSGAEAMAALQVGVQLAVGRALPVVLSGPSRKDRAALAELNKYGVRATIGPAPEGAVIVGSAADANAHIVIRARPDDEADDIGDWAPLVMTGEKA